MTTESGARTGIVGAARGACSGLALALLLPHAAAPAQERTSTPALIERLQQTQGGLARGAAQGAQEQPADELIRRIEVIQQQSLAAAADQQPALGEDEVRRLVREGLGVDVLSIALVERDGQPVYAVTVMNPPGNYNGALMVRTLLVDAATGGLLGELPHTPRAAAPDLSSDASAGGSDGSGLEIRRRTYR